MRLLNGGGIGARIALAALTVTALALAIVAIGVMVVGGQLFMDLMTEHGESAGSAREMFESTVLVVLAVAVLVSVALSVLLATLAGRWLSRPLRKLSVVSRAATTPRASRAPVPRRSSA